MKIMVSKYYEKLYAHKFDNLDENEPLLKSHELSKLTQQEKISHLFYEMQHYSGTKSRKNVIKNYIDQYLS